jgi:hypothetical protein
MLKKHEIDAAYDGLNKLLGAAYGGMLVVPTFQG